MANTLTATADPANGRMVLALTWDGPSPPAISRYDPDGTWHYVRGAAPASLAAGQWTGSDYEAATDTPYHYAVKDAAGTLLTGPVLVLPSNNIIWLKHPWHPEWNVRVVLAELPAWSREATAGVFAVIGRGEPVAVSMPRQAPTGALRFYTETASQRLAVDRILDDGSVLQLSVPGGNGIGAVWIAPGLAGEVRTEPYSQRPGRAWDLAFAVVARPA